MDLRSPPGPGSSCEEHRAYLELAGAADTAGDAAVRRAAAGLPVEVAVLDDYAAILDIYASHDHGIGGDRAIDRAHVDLVRHLADLVRSGASEASITAAAQRIQAALEPGGFRRVFGKFAHLYLFSPPGEATATELALEVHHPIRLDGVWTAIVVLREADREVRGDDMREVSSATWAGALERAAQAALVMLDVYARQHGGGTITDADPGA